MNGFIKQYSGFAQEHLLSRQLYDLMEGFDRIDVFERLYPKYEILLDEHFRKVLTKKYTELKLAEKELGDSEGFKQGEREKENTPIFQQVLEKHKGKVIYIDVLATWCGPCLIEMPFSKKMQNKFQGKDVVFVYFCVKSKKRKWESIVFKYNIKGDRYLLSDSQYDILSEKFQISGIPRYILVDKNGKVVDKNAQRPSLNGELNTDLINEIKSLIKD